MPWPFDGVFGAFELGIEQDLDSTTVKSSEILDVGLIHCFSGRLGFCDPFVNLGHQMLEVHVTPGDYPVRVTYATVTFKEMDASEEREAYLSVILDPGAHPVRREVLVPEIEGISTHDLKPGEFFGIEVDAGTVAVVDALAVAGGMPADPGAWLEEVFDSGRPDSWFNQMDDPDHIRLGVANLVLPRAQAGENLILSHSGWGDGLYPLVGSYDSQDRLVAISIDLDVIGEFANPG